MAQTGRRSRDQNVSWGAVEAIYRLGVSKSGKGCADYIHTSDGGERGCRPRIVMASEHATPDVSLY